MPKSTNDLIPPFIREIDPYVPGKPIEEVERELEVRAVKLASNENPLGPSPRAIEAARKALGESNRYPDGGGYYLRKALAERLRVPQENIILGNGSTDLIHLSAEMLLAAEDSAVTSEGSFPLYYIAVRKTGAKLIAVPQRNYAFDLDGIAQAIGPKTNIVYIANPNNPTGTVFDADAFDAFLARVPERVLVVLDEAYCDYVPLANYSRSIELVRQGKNLLVLRTFSKVYGLAGLRVGYGIGPAELLAEMNKIRLPFNTSGVGQAAALAALDDAEHVRRSVEANRAGLAQLGKGLEKLGVKFVPSAANFLLAELGENAEQLAGEMLKLGVIVRPMRWMGFPWAVRVSVGTAGENEKFLRALAQIQAVACAPGQRGMERGR